MSENVDHPAHYGGEDNPYETIKVLEAMGIGYEFCIGNAVKYLMRAGLKGDAAEDLDKAAWYCARAAKNSREDQERTYASHVKALVPDVPKPGVTCVRDADGDVWEKQPDGTWDWTEARQDKPSNYKGWGLAKLEHELGPLERM